MQAIDLLGVVQAVLRAPVQVVKVAEESFAPGWRTEDEVIVTHRCILITRGRIEYTVEAHRRMCPAGTMLWVPAWCRRQWRTGGRRSCGLLWCELAMEPVSLPPHLFLAEQPEKGTEGVLRRMLRRWPPQGREDALRLEAEAKGLAVRFWPAAGAEGGRGMAERTVHPEVRQARVWLEANFTRTDALEVFYRMLALSPNHFRRLFRKETGETVQKMLARLRLRRARYLTRETALPMKRIAAEAGFADPLYFSIQYRRFWGLPPTADREGGSEA